MKNTILIILVSTILGLFLGMLLKIILLLCFNYDLNLIYYMSVFIVSSIFIQLLLKEYIRIKLKFFYSIIKKYNIISFLIASFIMGCVFYFVIKDKFIICQLITFIYVIIIFILDRLKIIDINKEFKIFKD